MRPGEVTIMRSIDVDVAGEVWVYMPESHKTQHHDRPRAIYLGPKAQAVLRPWLRRELTSYLFAPAEAMAERGIATEKVKRRGRARTPRAFADRYDVAAYRRAIQRACGRAGVPEWHPNQLRHNAATALRREHGLDVARVVLGHAKSATTEAYAEIDQAKARDVMKLFG
jgi:integrase